jgi:hypothetical protein
MKPTNLEIEGLVAVEDEDESSELVSERLHGFGLSGSGRAERGTAETCRKGLGHCQVTPEIK